MEQVLTDKLRLVFMGTPELAATVLQAVLDWPGGEVVAVYTRPDRPAGRGYALKASPVKDLALARGLEVRQPVNFKDPAEVAKLAALKPDFLLVAAYGLILPQPVLDIPEYYPINVHTSLLPRYRGAAPIQRAIMNGDVVSGVTIMKMEVGLDSGPIFLQKALAIDINDTAGILHDQMARLGGTLLIEALEKFKRGQLHQRPQDDSRATYAAKLSKSDGRISFNQPALAVHARARGVTPWPGAFSSIQKSGMTDQGDKGEQRDQEENRGDQGKYTALEREAQGGMQVKLTPGWLGEKLPEENKPLPGDILGLREKGLAVACTDRVYLIPSLQPAGKKNMSAEAFVNGYLAKHGNYRFTD